MPLVLLGCHLVALCASPAGAAAPATWPDGTDVWGDARATWVYFSLEFDDNWSTPAAVETTVLEMRNKQVDVIIGSLTSTDMSGLSDPLNPRTVLYQHMVDVAASYGMVVYTGFWEDVFTGATWQLEFYTAVDHVIDFNAANSGADIVGVVSDFEMIGAANRNTTRYEQWRQFHSDLKDRIDGSGLKLVPVLNDPAVLISQCSDCDVGWLSAHGVSGTNPHYFGDVNYFTTNASGDRTLDGFIGLYYYGSTATIQSRAADDIEEASTFAVPAPVVVGFSVGPNFDPTLLTEAAVETAVEDNAAALAAHVGGTLGVMAWRWDDPGDGDAEYRGTLSCFSPLPAVEISLAHEADDVVLSWPTAADATAHYVHRGNDPQAISPGPHATVTGQTFNDAGAASDGNSYFYRVAAIQSCR